MVAIKTIRLVHLLSYVLVTSQVLFYLFILSDSLKLVSLGNFFELRKIIDSMMAGRFKFMYYSCLSLSIFLVVITAREPFSAFFISSLAALLFLSVDLFITVKGSLPLNALSHCYPLGSDNTDWESVRSQWLSLMKYRGMAIIVGMVALLWGLVFGRN
jgi:hypothetical protein